MPMPNPTRLLAFVVMNKKVNAKVAKKFVDQKFCAQLIDLFDSEVYPLQTSLIRPHGSSLSRQGRPELD